jgi:DNA-directed RNA polymerase subunit M/transcription elongation factor TFIIS
MTTSATDTDTDTTRISLKINKKTVVGLPTELRKKYRAVLQSRLGNHLTDIQLDILEDHINQAAMKCLSKKGLSNINMNDMRAHQAYGLIFKRVCTHLDPASPVNNTYLLNAVLNDEITIESVPTMSPMELHPRVWDKQTRQQIVEARQVINGNTNVASTKLLTCGKCHASEATYEEKQDRSADEAMTIHATCQKCGHVWTQ